MTLHFTFIRTIVKTKFRLSQNHFIDLYEKATEII